MMMTALKIMMIVMLMQIMSYDDDEDDDHGEDHDDHGINMRIDKMDLICICILRSSS